RLSPAFLPRLFKSVPYRKETNEDLVLREIEKGKYSNQINEERSLLWQLFHGKRAKNARWRRAAGDPFGYLRHQINRMFDDFWGEPWLAPRETFAGFWPQVDVTETDKEVKVCAEIPGVDAKDIDVSVEDGTLTIRGEKKYEREENEKGQYRMERSYGSFE